MTTVEVLDRYGTAALARVVGALLLVLALHLIRVPLVVACRVLAVALARADGYVAAQTSAPPTRRPTRWFTDAEGATNAYAG